MQSYKGRFEPTAFEDLTVTVDFHCNSACQFCIAADAMNHFKGVPFEAFRKAVDTNVREGRYKRITFTGGEVSLEAKLFDYIDYARRSGSFEHIRLQTNGRPMGDPAFAKRLVDAGIDEFFVSLHGPTAEVQDHIAQRKGGFDETIRGMHNLQDLGVCLMTNTVLTTLNVDHLAGIVERVREFQPSRMEWWNYLPMEDYADERNLLVPMERLAPALRQALDRARSFGIPTAVKYVPQCLLGSHTDSMDNSQSDVVIVEKFYDYYPEFSCLYEAKCEHAETCLGLTHPYISKFGWEEKLLVPLPRTRPWREPEYGREVPTNNTGVGAEPVRAGASDHPEWTRLVDGVAAAAGAELGEVVLNRRLCVYRFLVGGDSKVDLVLEALDESKPALRRSASFNIHYRNAEGPARDAIVRVIRAAAEAVVARDPGGMELDPRKGLVGDEFFRRRSATRTAKR